MKFDPEARRAARPAVIHDEQSTAAREYLVTTLRHWQEQLCLPRLSAYRIGAADFPRIVANSRGGSMKTNPVVLGDAEVAGFLAARR